MKLEKLDISSRSMVERHLYGEKRELSACSFANIYSWSSVFEISFMEYSGCLLVFFKDVFGTFLYIPPIGEGSKKDAAWEALDVMYALNGVGSPATRIENIREEDVPLYRDLPLEYSVLSEEYVSLTSSIARYAGERFKHKRSAYNHFEKNNVFRLSEYTPNDREECLSLYDSWARCRSAANNDPIYLKLLEDNKSALSVISGFYDKLGAEGHVIRIDGRIIAFTFGCVLSPDIFCVLQEVTDLSVKGASQYIFSSVARRIRQREINVMGDSGLENLKLAKLSFHPERTVKAFAGIPRR
jgi:hypothetical protein